MSGPVISTVEVMNEKEIVMKMLENCAGSAQDGVAKVPVPLIRRTIELIRDLRDEARPMTADDFKNADADGWRPAWVQEMDGECYWDTIRASALVGNRGKYVFWTAKPTEAQMREVEWNG